MLKLSRMSTAPKSACILIRLINYQLHSLSPIKTNDYRIDNGKNNYSAHSSYSRPRFRRAAKHLASGSLVRQTDFIGNETGSPKGQIQADGLRYRYCVNYARISCSNYLFCVDSTERV